PVITCKKTESEKFAGALRTYALEALMQDNKALQSGTSHNLGQNFAKAFNVQYQTAAGGLEYVWNTSWGVSTRMIGGLVMTHSDDNGLVCPPKLAPVQVVIVPIWKSEEEKSQVLAVGGKVKEELARAGVRVELDARDSLKPGAKYFEWEAEVKQQTGGTVRVLPDPEFRSAEAPKTCLWCGKPSVAEAVWAQAY